MKKLLIILFAFFVYSGLNAQFWVNNGGNLENTTSASVNVGVNNGSTDANIQIGHSRSADGHAFFDLVGDRSAYADFGVRLIRFGKGPNAGISRFDHAGTREMQIRTKHAGAEVVFLRENTIETMRLTADGELGLGTDLSSNPNGYLLAVNGLIGSKEVKVENTSSTWPDFVFQSDYNLRSINELENFINKNGHLPDIPSAKEIEEDGFFLGGMDAKLLQKIEELTLYIISQDKKIKQLEEKLNQLESK